MRDRARAWAATHPGRVRQHNEDCCQVGDWRSAPERGSWRGELPATSTWAAVADGMGGHRHGERASALVIECLAELGEVISGEEDIHRLLNRTNQRLFQDMTAPGGSPAMGSTVVGFAAGTRHGWIYNLGDSRAYLMVAGRMHLASKDHTPGRAGGGRSHALTQSLGGTLTPRPLHPHVTRFELSAVDAVLLCSDGLTDMVDDEEIEALLARGHDDPAVALVDAALDAGGHDNVTVVVIHPRG